MPQLNITYIFMTYIWTWLMLYLMMQKMKTMMFIKTPKNVPFIKTQKSTLTLPWT